MSEPLPRSKWSRRYVLFALPCITIGYFLIEHAWEASDYFSTVTYNFDGSENRTADRLDEAGLWSTAGRLALAAVGLLGLVIPSTTRLGWRKPLFWAMLAYVGWLMTTVIWSINPAFSAYKLCVLGVFGVAAFGISKHLTARMLVFVFAVSCIVYVWIGGIAELTFDTFHPRAQDYRFTGTTHPNTQAIYGAIICLAATLLVGKGQSTSRLFVAMLVVSIGVAVMWFSKSRTSLAALALAVIAAQALRAQGHQRVMLVVGGLSVFAVGLLVLALAGTTMQSKLGGAAELGRSEDMSTLSGRIPLWEELLDNYADRPFLGHGYLAFWDPEQVEYLGDLFNWEIPHGHNLYVDVLLDGGLIGLLLFLIFMGVGLVSFARLYRRTGDNGFAFAFGMICFALLHGISESLMKLPTFPNFVLVCLLFRVIWEPPPRSEPESDEQVEEPVIAFRQLAKV